MSNSQKKNQMNTKNQQSPLKPRTKGFRCCVCRKRLKPHEGKLCSCDNLLCLKHRYKYDHQCREGLVQKAMDRVVARKIADI